ncbi:restriction endonuclease subunit S [Dickeya dianthicola]|uniref:restriction endonuclease subunit S n=1 Tax=Dickeya dianthicola TaxID=204039 RepID=UPI001F604E61|nr:restriction endonuclease subunit S [Dickeya dianthicola]MCI4234463.1 restriction endonuclease subunit S [Dickeya dianthicola]
MSDQINSTLGELVAAGGGIIHTGPFGSQLHAADYVSEGIPCIMPANMKDNRVNLSGIAFISDDDAKRLSKYLVQEGDIVYSRRGDVTAKALIGINEVGYFCGTGCLLLRPGEKFDSNYLTYYLSTPRIQAWIISQAVGATMPNLNTGILFRIPFTGPEKPIQEKISATLRSIDDKIDLNNRINAELEAMAKTLYDYWFVQFDFPDANGKPYKTSGGKMEYNATLKREIPVDWEAGCASELFNFNPTTSLKTGCIAPYIDMDSLPIKGFMTKKIKKKAFTSGTKFIKNDVAIARITPCLENGKTGLISKLKEGDVGFGSTEFIIIRGKEFPLSGFGACLARSDSFRQFAISNMTGTTGRKRIESKTLETYTLPIPSKNLLMKFEDTVRPFFDIMTSKSVENDELVALRDWLLPLLMNGQVTVK